MHRLIMNAPDHLEVDHIHHNRLDNRKSELRLCLRKHNSYNNTPLKGSSSKYLGVTWDKEKGKWLAQIYLNYKNNYLGRYATEEEAALAYDKKVLELFGEFANLNFK